MNRALVIGANGGIARAVITALLADPSIDAVDAVSRGPQDAPTDAPIDATDKLHWHLCDSRDEAAVAAFATAQKAADITYRFVICTVGFLHNASQGIRPEKRLEDISADALTEYFAVNTIIPALWLKYLPKLVAKQAPTTMAFFSARVGSISDNRLGGWYGYRASKAALNMLVKNAAIELGRRHKHVTLMAYHPGTVDTGLSKPFQANVASKKLFTPAFTAQQLLQQMQDATPEHSPYYVDWDCQTIPW